MKNTINELFAGVGGFHLGFKKASKEWKVLWANQFEPSKKKQEAYECYKSNFPDTQIINEDINLVNNNYDTYNVPKANLLVGGFPCQDYSVATVNAKGIEGQKGVLWWEIVRFLDKHTYPFILLENVDRLLKSPSKQRGRDFAVILTCLRDKGYAVEWRVINASEYGLTQKRKRVFIFAYHKNTQYYKNREHNELNSYVDNGFFSNEFPISKTDGITQFNIKEDLKSISDKWNQVFYESGLMVNGKVITAKYKPKGTKLIPLKSLLEADAEEKYYLTQEQIDAIKYLKSSKSFMRVNKEGYEYKYSEGAVPFPDNLDIAARTILTSEATKNRSTHVILDPQTNRYRFLTPVECERINGFDDNWTNTGMGEKFRYFCMGNALVVGLVEKMGRELNKIFECEL